MAEIEALTSADSAEVAGALAFALRFGARWRDLPERFGPRTTCYNRFIPWATAAMKYTAASQ